MSDYGFKTVKTNKNGGKDTAINAKFPMMGFDMSHRPSSYITFHISDSKTNPIATSGNTPGYSAPSSTVSNLSNLNYGFYDPQGNIWQLKGGSNKTSGYVKTLIYQYEHGYNFRPACYGTITGSLSLQTTTNAIGTPVAGKYYFDGSLSNSNWNLMTAFNTTTTGASMGFQDGNLFPYMNGMRTIYGGSLNSHMFHYMMWANDVPTTSATKDAVQNGIARLTSYHFNNTISNGEYPYSFEVDDKYIKIYRTYYWSEVYGRLYFDHTFYDEGYNYRYYIEDYVRAKQVEQLYGSEIDITIMLFPYKMEDLK